MLDDTIELLNTILDDYDISNDEELIEVYKEHLVDKITDQVRDGLSDELSEVVFHGIEKSDSESISDFMNQTSMELEDTVWSDLEDIDYDKIKHYISNIAKQIEISDINILDMRYYLEISDSLASALKDSDDGNDDIRYKNTESYTSLIVAMFER